MSLMQVRVLFFVLIILQIIGCKSDTYKPESLRKLTHEEIKDRVLKDIRPPADLIVRGPDGNILNPDSLSNLPNIQEWTTDVYVDSEGNAKELVLRKATQEDLELRKEISRLKESEITIGRIEVNCDSLGPMLDEMFESDQGIRTGEIPYDDNIDHQNLIKAVSILEDCGMPTQANYSIKQIETIWLVVQHAPLKYQQKYIGTFRKSAEAGDLDWRSVVMMEDRILMGEGKPQIYGTQVTRDQETGEWILYNLKDPETVDQRRAEIGFGPLKEYLERFGVEFNIPQKEI